ncbi:MAG: LUD domain-containing protein [Actinomycetota bacterium]|nr:LUD domain-containing protein [Actinomycetota bacterium]
MIDALIAGLRANSCTVLGPMSTDDARAAIVARASGLVACNEDVPVPGIVDALLRRGLEVLTPGDPHWTERLADAAVGITGARLAVAQPPAIALAAAPGSPRATSLVPPEHVCVLRVSDVVAAFEDAMEGIAAGELPSALSWIGGPSRTADLEMITTLGVHGPRAVEVVLVS